MGPVVVSIEMLWQVPVSPRMDLLHLKLVCMAGKDAEDFGLQSSIRVPTWLMGNRIVLLGCSLLHRLAGCSTERTDIRKLFR